MRKFADNVHISTVEGKLTVAWRTLVSLRDELRAQADSLEIASWDGAAALRALADKAERTAREIA